MKTSPVSKSRSTTAKTAAKSGSGTAPSSLKRQPSALSEASGKGTGGGARPGKGRLSVVKSANVAALRHVSPLTSSSSSSSSSSLRDSASARGTGGKKKSSSLKNEQLLSLLDSSFSSVQNKVCGVKAGKLKKLLQLSDSTPEPSNMMDAGDTNAGSSMAMFATNSSASDAHSHESSAPPTLRDVAALRTQHKEIWEDMVSALSAL